MVALVRSGHLDGSFGKASHYAGEN
jgi:hypothetical protein